MENSWKAELTDVLGRCIQSQDRNLWIANILNLVGRELDKAREEVLKEVLGIEVDLEKQVLYSDGWGRMVVERILQRLSKLNKKK